MDKERFLTLETMVTRKMRAVTPERLRGPAPDDLAGVFPSPRFPNGAGVGPSVLVGVLLAGSAALTLVNAAQGWLAALPGVTLVLVAVIVHLTLRRAVVEPIQRLRVEVEDAAARGDVSMLNRPSVVELDLIVTGLRAHDGVSRPGRGRCSLGVVLVLVLCLVSGWAVAAGAATLATPTDVMATPAESRADLADVTDNLRDALRDGLGAVQSVATPPTGAMLTDAAGTGAQVLAAGNRFRSVSVVDRDGLAVATVGEPRRSPTMPPSPVPDIEQLNVHGAEPIVVASAPMWDGVHSLVAEFDPRALNATLGAPGRRTRVVDDGLRTVLDSGGYIAFTRLSDTEGGPAAAAALSGAPDIEGAHTAGRLEVSDSTIDPGWVVVQKRITRPAVLDAGPSVRAVLLIVALVGCLAPVALAWTALTVVRPARALARHVGGLGAGAGDVMLAPQRLDELGAITAAVNRLAARG